MAGPLDLNDLVSGLREVVKRAHEAGIRDVSIRIVGGAALRIAYFERATTADIDAQIQPLDQLEPIIGRSPANGIGRPTGSMTKRPYLSHAGDAQSNGNPSSTTRTCPSGSHPSKLCWR